MELLTSIATRSIVGIISGLCVGIFKGVKNFFVKKNEHEKVKSKNVISPIQPVMVVVPNGIVIKPIPINNQTKELLHISSNYSADIYKPKLIIPGEGLVNSENFIDSAIYELFEKHGVEETCVICNKKRKSGGYFGKNWYCMNHLPKVIEQLTNGEMELPWDAFNQQLHHFNSENNLAKQFFTNDIKRIIEKDQLLSELGLSISNTSHAFVKSNIPIPNLSGFNGSEELFILDVTGQKREMIITLSNCKNTADLFLGFGYIPTLVDYYKTTTPDKYTIKYTMPDKLLLVKYPHPGLWYIMLYGRQDYSNLTLSVKFN